MSLNVTKEFDQRQLFGVGIIVAVSVGVIVGTITGIEVAIGKGLTSGTQEANIIEMSKIAVMTVIFIISMLCKKRPNGRRPAPHVLCGVPASAGFGGQSHQTPNPPLVPLTRKCGQRPALVRCTRC
jgi:hypothetical protein